MFPTPITDNTVVRVLTKALHRIHRHLPNLLTAIFMAYDITDIKISFHNPKLCLNYKSCVLSHLNDGIVVVHVSMVDKVGSN